MSEEVPLKPVGKEDIRKLELALLLGHAPETRCA
jgi:predicted transcriptional regulator